MWPALLGLTQLLTGGSETARFLLVTVLMTAALALFFDLCRRLLPQWLAVVVLLGAACNPFTINFGGRVMSEAAFLFWSMLCLWALQRARGHETSRRFCGSPRGRRSPPPSRERSASPSWRGHLRLAPRKAVAPPPSRSAASPRSSWEGGSPGRCSIMKALPGDPTSPMPRRSRRIARWDSARRHRSSRWRARSPSACGCSSRTSSRRGFRSPPSRGLPSTTWSGWR
ncbi:MAG: hypothetical protein IPN16_07100 [Gemmatimonadetes bacterium]|nr:hypothetical protein [Gemmatimonadota bacterium]